MSAPKIGFQKRIDEDDPNDVFLGFSPSASEDDAEVWAIQRITGTRTLIRWANAGAYDVKWDDRLTADYDVERP